MPISRIFWSGGNPKDIHVVAGQSTLDLSARLLAFKKNDGTSQFAATYIAANADVTLVFTPLFKPDGPQPPNTHRGFGISVNTGTGVVTLDAALPSPTKRNFILEVLVTDNSVPATPVIHTEHIRIHVHQSISQIWLTPGTLTVRPFTTTRPENTDYQFSLRAQFDDGVVGDITEMSGVTWSSPAANANVNTVSGKLILTAANAVGNTVPITATLSAALGGQSTTANMQVAAAWDATSPVDAAIVVGGGWPGTLNPQSCPNVLFLGDGYRAGDEARFTSYVNSLVQFLKTNPLNRPYDVLSTSMNFWSAFVPSASIGVSVDAEVYPVGSGAAMTAQFVPGPEKPPTGHAGNYSLAQLIYVVGLPLASDDISNAARNNDAVKNEWNDLVSPDPRPKVDDPLINSWRALAKRSLMDAVDSAFGTSIGKPISKSTAMSNIDLNDRHISRDKLDHLLSNIRDPRGIPINDLWAKRADGTKPNNYDLICIIVAGHGRAVNGEGYFFVNFLDTIKIASIAGKNAFALNTQVADIPAASDNERGRLLAHELTHSFTVGDEYGESEQVPASTTSANVDLYANLTLEADAKRGADFHGDEVKWNWHRIRKAAVIGDTIADAGGGKYRIPLKTGQGYQFATGDTVHLRFRSYPQPLIKNPKLSPPLEVTDPAPTANEIHVRVKTGAVFTYSPLVAAAQFATEFLPGSIVYIPTPAPASVLNENTYPYAEMIGKNIKDHITNNHTPLTVYPSVVDTNTPQIPLLPGVSLPDCFSKHRPRIVGLYSGGMTYHKGLFHPTGNCIMREDHTDGREFCAVCRYILVDLIDPYQHWFIDRDYNEVYPQE